MAYEVTVIPGDGVGPELVHATKRVLDSTGVELTWDEQLAGEAAYSATGNPLPEETLASLKRTKIGIKGPVTTPPNAGFAPVNVGLRRELDLYASIRPCK